MDQTLQSNFRGASKINRIKAEVGEYHELSLIPAALPELPLRCTVQPLFALVTNAPSIAYGTGKTIWGLAGSASLREKTLIITVVNPHVSEVRTTEISLRGASARSCKAIVLAAPDIHAHNDFDHPQTVEPKTQPAEVSGARFSWTFPPASVAKLEIELG